MTAVRSSYWPGALIGSPGAEWSQRRAGTVPPSPPCRGPQCLVPVRTGVACGPPVASPSGLLLPSRKVAVSLCLSVCLCLSSRVRPDVTACRTGGSYQPPPTVCLRSGLEKAPCSGAPPGRGEGGCGSSAKGAASHGGHTQVRGSPRRTEIQERTNPGHTAGL